MEGEASIVEGVKSEVAAARVPRERFLTKVGVVMATLGSAVGLGNIWKFPYLTGSNGGSIFVVIYLVATLLIGIPVMVAELSIGRTARTNAVDSMQKISPNRLPWWLVGAFGLISAFIIMAYYTEVAAWVGAYIFKAFSAANLSTDPAVTTASFTSLITNPVLSLVIQWVDLALIAGIILLGVSKGIERVTRRLDPHPGDTAGSGHHTQPHPARSRHRGGLPAQTRHHQDHRWHPADGSGVGVFQAIHWHGRNDHLRQLLP